MDQSLHTVSQASLDGLGGEHRRGDHDSRLATSPSEHHPSLFTGRTAHPLPHNHIHSSEVQNPLFPEGRTPPVTHHHIQQSSFDCRDHPLQNSYIHSSEGQNPETHQPLFNRGRTPLALPPSLSCVWASPLIPK